MQGSGPHKAGIASKSILVMFLFQLSENGQCTTILNSGVTGENVLQESNDDGTSLLLYIFPLSAKMYK